MTGVHDRSLAFKVSSNGPDQMTEVKSKNDAASAFCKNEMISFVSFVYTPCCWAGKIYIFVNGQNHFN